MIHTDNVFSYGFTQFEEGCIRKLLPAKKSYLTSTECFTDVIACNSYAIFINAMTVSADDLQMLWEFYLEVGPAFAGEWIEYDRTLRGWNLTEGKSVLWGDL